MLMMVVKFKLILSSSSSSTHNNYNDAKQNQGGDKDKGGGALVVGAGTRLSPPLISLVSPSNNQHPPRSSIGLLTWSPLTCTTNTPIGDYSIFRCTTSSFSFFTHKIPTPPPPDAHTSGDRLLPHHYRPPPTRLHQPMGTEGIHWSNQRHHHLLQPPPSRLHKMASYRHLLLPSPSHLP